MLSDGFTVTFQVRWRDLDGNGHVGHTIYSLFALEARMECFGQLGWPLRHDHEVSGVILREEIVYRRELVLGETFSVHVWLSGLSADSARWEFRHRLDKNSGHRAATITTAGAFFSTAERRIVPPPPVGVDALRNWPRADNFTVIEPRTPLG